jgi:hypothetical protein
MKMSDISDAEKYNLQQIASIDPVEYYKRVEEYYQEVMEDENAVVVPEFEVPNNVFGTHSQLP